MVRRSLNIQYQSTGVGSLPPLDKIGVRRPCTGCVFVQYRHIPMDVLVKNIFFLKVDKSYRCLYEENKSNETIRRLLINTVPVYVPIDEIPVVRLFLYSL